MKRLGMTVIVSCFLLAFAARVHAQESPPAGAPDPTGPLTVGEMAVRVATGLGLEAPEGGFSDTAAAWALLQEGIRMRAHLGSAATEADAVLVLTALGYALHSDTPSRTLTRDRFELLYTTFITRGAAPDSGTD